MYRSGLNFEFGEKPVPKWYVPKWSCTELALTLENYLSYRLQIWYAGLYRECLAGAQIIFHESGHGLVQVTPTIFGIRSNISLTLLEL